MAARLQACIQRLTCGLYRVATTAAIYNTARKWAGPVLDSSTVGWAKQSVPTKAACDGDVVGTA